MSISDYVFPVLDVLRLTIKTQEVNVVFCVSADILTSMLQYWNSDGSAPNQVLSLKVVCNMFSQPQGFKLCMDQRSKIITAALALKDSKNKNVQISLSTVLLNFSVGLFGSLDLAGKNQVMTAVVGCLKTKPDPEAAFRLFISCGTLMHKDASVQKTGISLGLENMLTDYLRMSEPAKIAACAKLLQELLR